MNGWTIATLKAATGTLYAVGLMGCVLHALVTPPQRPPSSEFGLGPRRSAAGTYTAELFPEGQLATRKMQSLKVAVGDSVGRPLDGASILVSGGMPEHGHGLPTRPRVTLGQGSGEYVLEGLRFNMGGWWELKLYVEAAMGKDSITFNLDL